MYIISQILTKIDIYVNLVLEKEKVHSYLLLLPTLVYFLYIAKKYDKIASVEWTIYDFLILFFIFCAQLFFLCNSHHVCEMQFSGNSYYVIGAGEKQKTNCNSCCRYIIHIMLHWMKFFFLSFKVLEILDLSNNSQEYKITIIEFISPEHRTKKLSSFFFVFLGTSSISNNTHSQRTLTYLQQC